ncbi:hypothetical protein ABFS82_13G160600 [Erythranthe guttata]|uniref:Viral late gene transcription factor 3 zinc ribbon domain-containing protein n=1 Tax=Erythranthe guttata TaxID=4155 RepID=A0A022QIH7_ERYGU|nr:PREDICTED: uncharacterized protein LOC105968687 [Erythranthe guttata]EYU27419.1 hypothetical protein MIMGU_mgv1a016065mg [Erythranthe guttata]|eukprot:XP_012848782.1 PREDICTED: uncharacterized protein LOC105968687 [Erythranthe guttata]
MASAPPIMSSLHVMVPCPNYPSTRGFIAANRTTVHKSAVNTASVSTAAVNDEISAIITSDPAQAEITWQIVLGALAGVTPFVVAGIEFTKRIVEQKNCKVCKGSGLVLRDKKYFFRCPRCGGFLPWQSWRRFFTG